MPTPTFNHAAYVVRDLREAKAAAVGDISDDGNDLDAKTAVRWVKETAHTLDLIAEYYQPTSDSFMLDYGCGPGRVSKALVDRFGSEVVGADASESMRRVARSYVASTARFHTLPPAGLAGFAERFDFAWCIWVLQHSATPEGDIERIYAALKPGARLFVINELIRFVPTVERGFVNDGFDVRVCLANAFGDPIATGRLDHRYVSAWLANRTYWAVFQK